MLFIVLEKKGCAQKKKMKQKELFAAYSAS